MITEKINNLQNIKILIMPLLKYIARLKRIDELISKKRTGDSFSFARRLNLSRSSLLIYLKEMKELGFPIKFTKSKNSYYYSEEGELTSSLFEQKKLSREELKKITGGMASSNNLELICNNIRLWNSNLCIHF